MKPTLAALSLVAVFLALAAPTAARDAAEAPEVLTVGIKPAPPFTIRNEDGSWGGISLDLWEDIARQLELDYELEERDLEGMLTGLEDGSLDVAVAALTMTAAREEVMDFTHPFYSSGLGIAVAPERRTSWMGVLERLTSPRLLQAVGALALVLLVTGGVVWLLERRKNPEQFGGGVLEGLGNGFWWSAVTMTTVGYGDKAPATVGGRLVALLWMFVSVVTISGFTAAIASSLTVARLDLPVQGPEDLARAEVATLPASTSARYLEERQIAFQPHPTLERALNALADGEVEAVVYDAPLLHYWIGQRYEGALEVLPGTFEPQEYAIGLTQGSPLREPVNRLLLAETDKPSWRRVLKLYLGD